MRSVNNDQQGGRATSVGGGRTYDGAGSHGGSEIGGTGIGMDGAGDGAGAQGKSLPANAKGKPNEQDPPVPDAPAKDVTPWAKHIMGAMALGAIAIAAMIYASTIIKAAKIAFLKAVTVATGAAPLAAGVYAAAKLELEGEMTMARLLIGAGIAAGLATVVLGGMVTGEPNGQKTQGGILIASGLAIMVAGSLQLASTFPSEVPYDEKAAKADATYKLWGTPSWTMIAIGAAGAIGLISTMMAPKNHCKSNEEGCHAYI